MYVRPYVHGFIVKAEALSDVLHPDRNLYPSQSFNQVGFMIPK